MAGKKRFVDPPTEAHRKVARALVQDGKSFSDALAAGGFSPKQARKGTKLLKARPVLARAITEEWKKLEKKHGPAINNPKLRERAVLTRLMENVLTGRDRAVGSCKLIGQDRRLNMWQPDSVNGIVVLQAPPNWPTVLLDDPNHLRALGQIQRRERLHRDPAYRDTAEGRETFYQIRAYTDGSDSNTIPPCFVPDCSICFGPRQLQEQSTVTKVE